MTLTIQIPSHLEDVPGHLAVFVIGQQPARDNKVLAAALASVDVRHIGHRKRFRITDWLGAMRAYYAHGRSSPKRREHLKLWRARPGLAAPWMSMMLLKPERSAPAKRQFTEQTTWKRGGGS